MCWFRNKTLFSWLCSDKGDIGDVGRPGLNGYFGVKGDIGETGPEGPQGNFTINGLKIIFLHNLIQENVINILNLILGFEGLKGVRGINGLPGPPGLMGIPGLKVNRFIYSLTSIHFEYVCNFYLMSKFLLQINV